MKAMVRVTASNVSGAGAMQSEALLTAMAALDEDRAEAGAIFSGEDRAVTDGPFAEPKEPIAGFWLALVTSLQDEVDDVSRCSISPGPVGWNTEKLRPRARRKGRQTRGGDVTTSMPADDVQRPPRFPERIIHETLRNASDTGTAPNLDLERAQPRLRDHSG
ncbi:MAG: YciI family protein [Pseudomonadota bacterium]